ncbi:MAG: histone deacetylase family protein [Rhodospirillaceae bacterium]|nr:histone deacetylase family protein [Rhodospirillaceae bacterium]
MQVFFSDVQLRHAPHDFLVRGRWQPCPEKPERATALKTALAAAGHAIATPSHGDDSHIAAVHDARYLAFLETGHERWRALPGASELIVPNIHPNGRPHGCKGGYPQSIVGQAGYHMADTACPIGAGSWSAIRASADCAIAAAGLVLDGAHTAYALCRPPGHHAFADMAGGFCYLNNSGIAAGVLRGKYERVAIVDVDLHHGNGTQGMFYHRGDVLTVSMHADPANFYPFFWGYAEETGEGDGKGANLNLPLPLGSGDEAFLTALDTGLKKVRDFGAEAIVVALGLDAFAGDPFAGLKVSEVGFHAIAARLGQLQLPTVLVQEGGYLCPELGRNLVVFLEGFEGTSN